MVKLIINNSDGTNSKPLDIDEIFDKVVEDYSSFNGCFIDVYQKQSIEHIKLKSILKKLIHTLYGGAKISTKQMSDILGIELQPVELFKKE